MIFVRRDSSLIPRGLLLVADRAQRELEGLPPGERIAFIKRKSHIWRKFSRYLAKMSYRKCWYSESFDPQSFYDVDHFRPKAEAIRSDDEKDNGYPWLAFSWENFRYSAQRSNRLSADEVTEETAGKGSWFPLMPGSPKACWTNRCEKTEAPVLLDPAVRDDADLVNVAPDGRICGSPQCIGSAKVRLQKSVELYGLDLPNLVEARKRVMRHVIDTYESLVMMLEAADGFPDVADSLPVQLQISQLKRATCPQSPYSKAARAQLFLMPEGAYFASHPEECEVNSLEPW